MTHKMKLHPFWAVVKEAQHWMNEGADVHQQFNCAGCGVKQTMDTPNIFYKTGECEECHHVTDIEKDGCNYMAHINFGRKP